MTAMGYRQDLKPVNHRIIAGAWSEIATALSSPYTPHTRGNSSRDKSKVHELQKPGAHENCKWWVMQEQDQQQLTRVAAIQQRENAPSNSIQI